MTGFQVPIQMVSPSEGFATGRLWAFQTPGVLIRGHCEELSALR